MKRLLLFVLVLPLTAFADGPFDGTWVTQPDSTAFPKKPDVIVLEKGMWEAKSAVPPIKVKADGTDQNVSGHAYYDSVAVKVIGPDSVDLTMKKAGKVTVLDSYSVSADGKVLTLKFTDQTGTEPATGQFEYARIAPGPKGSASVSGSWRATKMKNFSSNGLTMTCKLTSAGMAVSNPTGQSYDAKFDGKYHPVAGDSGETMVMLKRVNANTIIETDKRLGKVTDVVTMTVAADGTTMHVVDEDKLHGTSQSWTNKKSP